MSFVPVIIINLILLIITILLAIADKLLVSYGQCKITVRQDEDVKEFTVQGGNHLLSSLIENNISITSSCAGKASCGYCKVRLKGGGSILPTEEIFMSREEKLAGMRLACQVKVKEDLDIYIPDFLTTVKGIVKNKTYDPKLRWKFIKTGQESSAIERADVKLARNTREKVEEIIEEYKGVPGAVVPVLQRISGTFNYLPEPVLRYTAKVMDKPMSELYRLATFYNAFSLEPRGKVIVKVCLGTACYVKGGSRILDTVRRKLGLQDGNTTKDLKFSTEIVSCIGCCGQSPVISVDGDIYGYLKPGMIDNILERYSTGIQNEKNKA
ncbi:MAG: 2Fe-2S iron-sulfur cluster binding domain-containing protein [Planctomycetes bacterium]|nr:2Fe-2S iron-sulfur cluster binding domain-containing protein [Planctomycetota bacterium]